MGNAGSPLIPALLPKRSLSVDRCAFGHQCKVQKSVRVVEGRPQNLPAGKVLESRADAPVHRHRACIDGA